MQKFQGYNARMRNISKQPFINDIIMNIKNSFLLFLSALIGAVIAFLIVFLIFPNILLEYVHIIYISEYKEIPIIMPANQLYSDLVNFFAVVLAIIGLIIVLFGFLFYFNAKAFIIEQIQKYRPDELFIKTIAEDILAYQDFEEKLAYKIDTYMEVKNKKVSDHLTE